MRGKEIPGDPDAHRRGITPAYAGKRRCSVFPGFFLGDHPRVCGEKRRARWLQYPHLGSPPRMRGKEPRRRNALVPQGITPAYAGKSIFNGGLRVRDRDHPRVCGEKKSLVTLTLTGVGSPPRMRGKDKSCVRNLTSTGITPAYAGKSSLSAFSVGRFRDHPRVCGEKIRGSPPRMRGKVLCNANCVVYVGITPAYAGKSMNWILARRAWWDHPRVCGEKIIRASKTF